MLYPENVKTALKRHFFNSTLYHVVAEDAEPPETDDEGTVVKRHLTYFSYEEKSRIACSLERDVTLIREQFGETSDIEAMAVVLTDFNSKKYNTHGEGLTIGDLYMVEQESFTNGSSEVRKRVYELTSIKLRDTHILLGLKRYRRNNFLWIGQISGPNSYTWNQKDDDWLNNKNPNLE